MSSRSPLTWAALLCAASACAESQEPCSAPSSGTFRLSLSYSQTLPVGIGCPGGEAPGTTCGAPPPVFDGTSWTVTVNGSSATLASVDASADAGASGWACSAIAPESTSVDLADSGIPSTGCYLLVRCNQESASGIGPVQIQISSQSSTSDVMALVQESAGACCVDEYTGTWN